MTQTPLQKAIEQLKEKKNTFTNIAIRAAFNHSIDMLTDLLPYEREVIEGAFSDGNFNMHNANPHNNKSDYFTKTFINNDND